MAGGAIGRSVTAMRRILCCAIALTLVACSGGDDAAPTASRTAHDATATTEAPGQAPSVTSGGTGSSSPARSDPATTSAPAALPATTAVPATALPLPVGYPAQPAGVPWPTSSWPTAALPAGVDQAALDAAVAVAFGAPDAQARVRSIVVVHGGSIVYERYHPLDGPDVVMSSFSVAKSFTSALVGMLIADGVMSLDEHPPRPEWQAPGDPRQAITLREMLQMSSGLEWTEEFTPDSLLAQMISAEDAAALMAAQPLESEPGSTWEYSTGTSVLVAGIAADALGSCQAETDYLHGRLLDPLGITTEQVFTDGRGCFFGGAGMDMTTRDFARFGLLYLRGGRWGDEQLLPASWIDETRVPAPTSAVYGLQWWLSPDGRGFSAMGLFGQRIVVVPEADLVIAINSTQSGDPDPLQAAVLAAFGVA